MNVKLNDTDKCSLNRFKDGVVDVFPWYSFKTRLAERRPVPWKWLSPANGSANSSTSTSVLRVRTVFQRDEATIEADLSIHK
jgi:hypothetical protein